MLVLLHLLLLADPGPFADPNSQTVVLLFTRTDCPISNRYAPEVTRLQRQYSPRGVRFWLVYPDPASTPAQREAHRIEYGYRIPAIPDPDHRLVARAAALVTPEAAVFIRNGESWKRVYRGSIDDRYTDFGKYRPAPQHRHLAEALDNILAGQSVKVRDTKSIGCAIADLR